MQDDKYAAFISIMAQRSLLLAQMKQTVALLWVDQSLVSVVAASK